MLDPSRSAKEFGVAAIRDDVRRRPRMGFTIIELLVVILVIGLLAAMLFPALQAVMELTRGNACRNNLRQIGLALRGYESTWDVFPPSRIRWRDETGRDILHSWTPSILGYCEQKALADQYNYDRHWRSNDNGTVVKTFVSLFVCPSTSNQRRVDLFTGAASGDYGAINEVKLDYYDALGIEPPLVRAGAMTRWLPTARKDVTDGDSHTILIAEDAGRPEWWIRRKSISTKPTRDGNGWADPDCGFSVSGVTEDGMFEGGQCVLNCSNDSELYSFHNDGLYALFADGSVRFLSEQIHHQTLVALVTRAGEELLANTID